MSTWNETEQHLKEQDALTDMSGLHKPDKAKSRGVAGLFWTVYVILIVAVAISTLFGVMTGVQAIGTGLLMLIAYYVRRVAHAIERK